MESNPFPPCPHLPVIDRAYTAEDIHQLGKDRSETFYGTALHYAQSLWLEGYPAKALLLVNRALSCRLPGLSLQRDRARPYLAVAWMLHHRPEGLFIGNPRRHYQHLATRMVEPHKTLRTWRAWSCWYLAKQLLPETAYPADEKQIREESIVEPARAVISQHLAELSPSDDVAAWEEALAWAGGATGPAPAPRVGFPDIALADLAELQVLAREIWLSVYPSIISQAQIHYMLDKMYGLEKLRNEILSPTVSYRFIQVPGETPAGFYAWEMDAPVQQALLHKLYLKPDHHGRGLGQAALQHIIAEAAAAGAARLSLRVNRHNHAAIRAYLRAGFTFESDLETDIGGGFVMDDHIMVRPVPSAA
jgi:RimJ/RimL family protein N-acetyltransferase